MDKTYFEHVVSFPLIFIKISEVNLIRCGPLEDDAYLEP